MSVYFQENRHSFFLLGFNTVIIQLVILRELFSIFSGNELLAGLVLACWFIFTGLGAYVAKFKKSRANFYLAFLLITLPLVLTALLLLAVTYFKNQLFHPGVMQGPVEIFFIICCVLFPVCFLSGAAFTVFASCRQGDKNEIAGLYAVESLGSITGGALFSFVLIHFFDGFQILSIVAALNAFYFVKILTTSMRTVSLWFHVALMLLMAGVLAITDIKDSALERLFSGQKIIETSENEFGKLVVTKSSGQFNMYQNGSLINTGNNEIAAEESAHYAMIQRPQAHCVLQISGNAGLIGKEIQKYPVKQIDFVDMNKDGKRLEKKYFSSDGICKSNQYITDPRLFVRKTVAKYDVVLLNTPEPMFAQTNRFYTIEFFKELKKCMNENSVLGLSMPGVENYMNRAAADMNSSIYNTLKAVFRNVILIPGNRLFFISSDGPLTMEIAAAINQNNITNLYVNEYFIDDELLSQKSKTIMWKLDPRAQINHDFKPVTYYYGLQFWLSHYRVQLFYPLILICVIFLLLLSILKPVNIALMSSGFTASSVEMIVIVAFQALYGYVYSQLGIIFTLFMAGLFAGSYFFGGKIRAGFLSFILLQAALLLFLSLAWLFFENVYHLPDVVQYVFYLILFLQATITGMQFAVSTKLKQQPVVANAGNSYSIELVGSAAGALLVTTFAIPLLGIQNTLVSIILFNAYCLLIILINKFLFKRFF